MTALEKVNGRSRSWASEEEIEGRAKGAAWRRRAARSLLGEILILSWPRLGLNISLPLFHHVFGCRKNQKTKTTFFSSSLRNLGHHDPAGHHRHASRGPLHGLHRQRQRDLPVQKPPAPLDLPRVGRDDDDGVVGPEVPPGRGGHLRFRHSLQLGPVLVQIVRREAQQGVCPGPGARGARVRVVEHERVEGLGPGRGELLARRRVPRGVAEGLLQSLDELGGPGGGAAGDEEAPVVDLACVCFEF